MLHKSLVINQLAVKLYSFDHPILPSQPFAPPPPPTVARQQEIIHKLDEAKEARVTLNRMRREHQDKIRQQEQEQTLLARMQMEQKLALLRQQKAEQFTFQQALQKQRLDDLQTQRSEYEKQLIQQREAERLQLIAKEQQVMHQQFGQGGYVDYMRVITLVLKP